MSHPEDETVAGDDRTQVRPKAGMVVPLGGEEGSPKVEMFGDFRLVRKIAQGGMGQVFEAIQVRLDRRVAVKVLSEEFDKDQDFLTRFEREAKSAAALNHPNIVQVHDFGEDQGRHYLVMEFVDGVDLAKYLAEHGKLTVEEGLRIIKEVAYALQAAMEQSIIHRDIKPSNILRTMDGRIKVSDLGLAKRLTEDLEVTASGVGIGSPHFISPEQADDAAKVDHRSDIYSLGITLFYLLTGKRPFDGTSAFSIVLAHANKPIPSGADLGTELPEPVEMLLQHMVAKKPEHRYLNYQSLIEDIDRVRHGLFPITRDESTFIPGRIPSMATRRRRKTNPLWWPLVGTASVLVIVLAVSLLLREGKTNTPSGNNLAGGKAEPQADPESTEILSPATEPLTEEERGIQDIIDEFMAPPGMADFSMERVVPKMPTVTTNLLTATDASGLLLEARQYQEENPGMYAQILANYEQVMTLAGEGSEEGKEAETLAGEVSQKRHVEADAEFTKRTKEMREFLMSHRPIMAVGVWEGFPTNLLTAARLEAIEELIINFTPPTRSRGPGAGKKKRLGPRTTEGQRLGPRGDAQGTIPDQFDVLLEQLEAQEQK